MKKVYNESQFLTENPLHIESRSCGLFVVGEGNCIPVNNMDEARNVINKIKIDEAKKVNNKIKNVRTL